MYDTNNMYVTETSVTARRKGDLGGGPVVMVTMDRYGGVTVHRETGDVHLSASEVEALRLGLAAKKATD